MKARASPMLDAHLQALLAGLFLACALNFLVARAYGPHWARPMMLYAAVVMVAWCGFYVAASVNTVNDLGWLPALTGVARTLQYFNVFGLLATGIMVAWPYWQRVIHRNRGSVEGERMSCGKSP